MHSTQKRIERRTRTVSLDGRQWVVSEQELLEPNGASKQCLVFATDGETRRVREFPWLWYGLLNDELGALSRPDAPPMRRVPKTAVGAMA